MIILNMGVPRSGTVLVNAILREILKAGGIQSLQANPHGKELPALLHRVFASGQERYRTILVHTHSWDAESARIVAGSPFVVAFANLRDPRDVCVSLMRLHEHDFETTARMTLAAFREMDAAIAATAPMVIPYELLVAEKRAHIFQIARRLGLWAGLDTVARIDEATSMERHRAVMEKVQAGTVDKLQHRKNANRVLAEDPESLINDRHIQSGRSGRWRDELSEAEKAEAGRVFAGLLKRYGYAAEGAAGSP